MIHLDTNYLIGLLVKDSPQARQVDVWLAAGQVLAASAITWTEFLDGPYAPEISRAEAVLQSRIIPFDRPEAVLAADLFNRTGRRRGSRFDCLIAATAIIAGAEIATINQADFKVFVSVLALDGKSAINSRSGRQFSSVVEQRFCNSERSFSPNFLQQNFMEFDSMNKGRNGVSKNVRVHSTEPKYPQKIGYGIQSRDTIAKEINGLTCKSACFN